MNGDFKIENESFWFDPLDEFQLFDEIVVVQRVVQATSGYCRLCNICQLIHVIVVMH